MCLGKENVPVFDVPAAASWVETNVYTPMLCSQWCQAKLEPNKIHTLYTAVKSQMLVG